MNHHHYDRVALDSHVHFYDCWQITLDQLLTCTYQNILSYYDKQQSTRTLPAACLLETSNDLTPIRRILVNAIKMPDNAWEITQVNDEPCSFWAKKQDKIMLVITGQQITTSEGLEVLVIGKTEPVQEGMTTKSILEYNTGDSINIIPWAVGKWLGNRGKLVTQLLQKKNKYFFILGDNAGRPWIWKNIIQFQFASRAGLPVLAGSDPLPLKRQYIKSGSYGSTINVQLDIEKPWASIINAIQNNDKIKPFGKLSSISRFILNQINLRR